MALIERLFGEWSVIADAPYTHWLLFLAVLLAAVGGASLWYRKQLADAAREVAATKAEKALAEAVGKQLKEESANLSTELTALKQSPAPSAFNQIAHSSTAVLNTLFEIEEKKTTRFMGSTLADFSPEQLNKFAQFSRLRDAGAVHIHGASQGSTVVTSTSTASEMVTFIKLEDIKFKKP